MQNALINYLRELYVERLRGNVDICRKKNVNDDFA